ncbi:chorismate lyase [Erythrobacter sp. YT30]|uniref:chorismate lyase n=1 Tax=Erythrobacter sp. YT30 TaxID=1735012 RepID=UPI00076DEDA0|nr:chorismate lyase [Erythrobacter sp. YT30]KWV91951.1 hypothetical protein AUC45_12370 [Erythrobacter sp. YT30]
MRLAADAEDNISSAATWLLKSWLEKGGAITTKQTAELCAELPGVTSWQAQLHLCQSIRFLDVTKDAAAAVHRWLVPLLAHDRPFVRAWSLDALASLARQHSHLHAAFAKALEHAEQDEAASVRARARNIKPIVSGGVRI